MNIPYELYNEGEIVEILPAEECDTSYGPGYVYEMIDMFKKNPEVKILYDELHSIDRYGEVFYYYQYKVRDFHGETRYVNEDWIRPRSTTALFV